MRLRVALVGCGAMGSALLRGWLTLSDSESRFKNIWVITPHRESAVHFLDDSRVEWFASPSSLPHSPDIIVFAVKPHLLEEILPLYKSFDSLIISVASGKPLSFYKKVLPLSHTIVRAMPNTPVEIHKGVIAFLANTTLTPDQMNMINICFKDMGFCLWVSSDNEIDKITAISGSGPAYVFYMIEAFAQGAESLGFHKEMALSLAVSTFWGSSVYAHDLKGSPAVLRKNVTSPQGTTAAALNVLETGNLHALMEAAMKAAYTRAKELRG